MKSIVRVLYGSHLFGTNTPSSDTDYKQVHLPSADEILGERVRRSVSIRPQTHVANTKDDIDEESYSVGHFLEMLSNGDTIATELLFAPFQNLMFAGDGWCTILGNRERLVHGKIKGYVGYCRGQAATYSIKGDRVAAARATLEVFREGYGEFRAHGKIGEVWDRLAKVHAEHPDHTGFEDSPANGRKPAEEFFIVVSRKYPKGLSFKFACEQLQKVVDEYGHRALAAETSNGVDWKAISHAVRIGEEAVEFLTTGHLTFPRPNADDLVAIKRGLKPYQEACERIDASLALIEDPRFISVLRPEPDREFYGALLRSFNHRTVTGSPAPII